MKVKNDQRRKFSNFKKLERRSLKKKNQGFNGIRTRDLRVTGALLYQLSYELCVASTTATAVQKWIILYILHIIYNA